MAAKSDLGQKLLHDLRLRKERMAAAQSYGNSHSSSRGGYANAGQPQRGSRQIKALESVGSRARSSQASGRGNRSFQIQESAGQIVPYADGRVQNSGKIDLSMAITFAIENRGKFTKLNTPGGNNLVLGFLHQMRRSSSSQFVTLSNVQVNEISKGIQKINQVLKACSNGVNFDRYSTEVGKELLKGAMDLESSLRVLVNMQEASDYMIKPQRKNRITLLDEDDEEDAVKTTADQKQLDLPRFSFDKPRKSYSKKETILALTYPTEEEKFRPNEKKPLHPSNMSAHKRSSSTPDFKAISSNLQSTSSTYGAEKGRISNVIAKLMGLDELPQNAADTKASKNTAHPRTQFADSENKPPPNIDNKTKPAGKQSNISPIYQLPGSFLKKEREPTDNDNIKAQTIETRSEPKLPHKHKMEAGENLSLQVTKHRKNTHQTENNVADRLNQGNQENPQQKPRKSDGSNDKYKKLEERKLGGSKVEAGISKKLRNKGGSVQKRQPSLNQAQNSKTGSTNPTSARPQKDLSNNNIHPEDDLAKHGRATMQSVDQNASPQESTPRIQKASIPTLVQEKPIKVPVTKKKESYIQIHRNRLDGRKGTPKSMAGSLKQQLPMLQVKKQLKHNVNSSSAISGKLSKDNSKESKEFEKSEVSNESPDATKEILHCETKESCDVANENQCRNLEVSTPSISTGNLIDATELSESEHKDVEQQLAFGQNPENSQNTLQNRLEGHQEISKLSQDEEVKIVPTKIAENPPEEKEIFRPRPIPKQQTETCAYEPLTEPEKHLKETLIKSHLFLSTAEALLKLNLPISVLHGGDHINQGNNKLTVDCGYEVMRRKARRQELALHPCAKNSITYIKVRSLDDLIKQLCKDFDKLNSYGGEAYESTQYFQNMLEKDMLNRDPDINSVWDFGWEENMFGFLEKDEIAKDVEKHLLRGLIDEITIDLL